nr:hypothetical protein CFP56_03715 [Quercus suber]
MVDTSGCIPVPHVTDAREQPLARRPIPPAAVRRPPDDGASCAAGQTSARRDGRRWTARQRTTRWVVGYGSQTRQGGLDVVKRLGEMSKVAAKNATPSPDRHDSRWERSPTRFLLPVTALLWAGSGAGSRARLNTVHTVLDHYHHPTVSSSSHASASPCARSLHVLWWWWCAIMSAAHVGARLLHLVLFLEIVTGASGSLVVSNSAALSSSAGFLASNASTTPGPPLTSSATTTATATATSTNAHTGSSAFELTYGPDDIVTLYECSSSGIVQASACSSSWVSWSTARAEFVRAHGTVYTTTTAFPSPPPLGGYTSILGRPESETTPYATCNGIPRYHGGWTSTGQLLLPTVTTNITVEVLATSIPVAFAEPQPSCCIGSTDCLALQQEWHGLNELLYPFNNTVSTWLNGPPIDYPHCETELEEIFGTSGAGDCSGCWILGENAHLYYWPQDVEEGPLCPDSYALKSPTATVHNNSGPVTAVLTYSNPMFYPNITTTTTLTSPTIYMSVENLQGRDGCHDFYGAPFPGTVFALGPKETQSALMTFPGMTDAAASSSFASIIAHQETAKYTDLFGIGYETLFQTRQKVYPIVTQLVDINMADLARPPPYLSYFLGDAGAKCIQGDYGASYFPCGTIFDKYVTPDVRLGTAVRSFRSEWASCNLDFGFDPPIALTPASSVAPFSFPSPEPTTTWASTTSFVAESVLASETAVPRSSPDPRTADVTVSGTHTTSVGAHGSIQPSLPSSTDSVSSLETPTSVDDPATPSSAAERVSVADSTTSPDIPSGTRESVITVTEVASHGVSVVATLTLAAPSALASQDSSMQSNRAGESVEPTSRPETTESPADRVIAVTELGPNGATVTTTLELTPSSPFNPPKAIDPSGDPGEMADAIYTLTEIGGTGEHITTTLTIPHGTTATEAVDPNARSFKAGEVTFITEIIQDGSSVVATFTLAAPSTAPSQHGASSELTTMAISLAAESLADAPSTTTTGDTGSSSTALASQSPSIAQSAAAANQLSALRLVLIYSACTAIFML